MLRVSPPDVCDGGILTSIGSPTPPTGCRAAETNRQLKYETCHGMEDTNISASMSAEGGIERWNRIVHGCSKLSRQLALLKAHTKIRPSFGTGRVLAPGISFALKSWDDLNYIVTEKPSSLNSRLMRRSRSMSVE